MNAATSTPAGNAEVNAGINAEILAELAHALHDWFGWAHVSGDGGPPGNSAVLRQRMADLLIEHRVASAVVDEARQAPPADALDMERLSRRRVARCLDLAIDVIGCSRGALAVAWMRDELTRMRQESGQG
ncbi:MAG: hypothetical protein ACRCYQ_06435 [Nocardioides sp.]